MDQSIADLKAECVSLIKEMTVARREAAAAYQRALEVVLQTVGEECQRARRGNGMFRSAHEAYAVILEELDEFKAHVWMRPESRDLYMMRKELAQIAAMAVCAILEVCWDEENSV